MVFPVVLYECQSWTIKKAECQRTDASKMQCWRRPLRVSLDSKEIKPVNPKGNQPWVFIGRIDAEAKVPIFWPPDMKSWLTGKDPDAGKGWGQEEKGAAEDEMVGWHHWLNGHESEQTWEIVKDSKAWRAIVYGVKRVGKNLANEQGYLPH